MTAAYLAAGMRLIERHLGPGAVRLLVDPDDEDSVERPVPSFLSQRAVTAEVANNPDPLPKVGSVSTLRSTWRSQSDFIADVLNFGLWVEHTSHQTVSSRQSRSPRDRSAFERSRPANARGDRELWRAFTDGLGGSLDLFGGIRRPREPLPAFEATLTDDLHDLCLILGLTPESDHEEVPNK